MQLMKAIAILLWGLIAMAGTSHAQTVGNLRCEYLHDPLGIDVSKPRLNWIEVSGQRGTMQTAYRVLVSTTPGNLAGNQGDLWDSGRVNSDQSTHVEYAGAPLKSGQVCYWKVLVWTNTHPAPIPSSVACWSMGLLKAEDWTGKWIGKAVESSADQTVPPPAPLLRKAFVIKGPVRRATAYICGLGYYELSMNGFKIGNHVLDPPITDYTKRVLYVTHDVTARLCPGKNAVGVELGSSWYNSAAKDAWDFYKAPWRALPQMIFQLNIEYADGSVQKVVSDDSWKMSTGAIRFDQTRVGETYDARLEKPGWNRAGFNDSTWEPVAIREGPKGKLAAANVEPVKVMATIRSVKVKEPKPGIYVFDLGQNITGWPCLSVRGPAGGVVKMRCGERLNPNGTVNQDNIRQFVSSPDFQTDSYTLRGGARETWEPKFTYHGFQYVQVEGLPEKATLDTISGRVVYTSFERTGTFECSHALLNKIERATVWSYIGNFVGYPSDCPHREKNGWTGDAQLAVQMGLEHFRSEAAYTRWMNDMQDAQRPDGKLPCIVPTGGWGYDKLDGPAWESAYFLIPWEMYRQSGDRRILESRYESYKKWIDWYTRIARGGIVRYGLGDWAPAKTKTPSEVTSTSYYYRDIRIVAQVAEWLGRNGEAKAYRELADKVGLAFKSNFFDTHGKQYAGKSQTALSCALYQELVDPDRRQQIADELAGIVNGNGGNIDTGILGAKYILRALSDNGHADAAWEMATRTTRPGWGFWIQSGMTTLAEDWSQGNSLNHVMFGDISSWFMEYLAGIRLDRDVPGYKKIVIHPLLPDDLSSAKATRESLYGRICTNWFRVGDDFTLKLVIPDNTTAIVHLPAKDAERVTEGGTAAARAAGVRFVRMENEAAIYEVGSGNYEFRSKLK